MRFAEPILSRCMNPLTAPYRDVKLQVRIKFGIISCECDVTYFTNIYESRLHTRTLISLVAKAHNTQNNVLLKQ